MMKRLPFFHKVDSEGPFFGSKLTSQKTSPPMRIMIFGIVCALLVLYFLFQGFPHKTQQETSQKASLGIPTVPIPTPFLEYAKIFKQRDIFKLDESIKESPALPLLDNDLARAAASLTLMGIITEKEEPIALIQDKTNNKTFNLRQGEYLKNIRIEKIQRGKVKLRLGNQTLDLEL